jgi:hypothetical protein
MIRHRTFDVILGNGNNRVIAPQAAGKGPQVLPLQDRLADQLGELFKRVVGLDENRPERRRGPERPLGARQKNPPASMCAVKAPLGYSVSAIVSNPINRSHFPSRPRVFPLQTTVACWVVSVSMPRLSQT